MRSTDKSEDIFESSINALCSQSHFVIMVNNRDLNTDQIIVTAILIKQPNLTDYHAASSVVYCQLA